MGTHSAVEQSLGYIYQLRATLYYILSNSDLSSKQNFIIEGLDDIEIRQSENLTGLVQLKHHVKGKANLTNSSVDLWKTLGIWIELYNKDELKDVTNVYLITTNNASKDSIAYYLGDRQSRSTEKAISILDLVANESENVKNKDSYDLYKNLTKVEKEKLVDKIKIIDSFNTIADIKIKCKNIFRVMISPEYLDKFYERFEGWWFDYSINHLLKREKFELDYTIIQSKASDLRDQFTMDNLPNDFPTAIDSIDIERLPSDMKVFIEQLKLIGVGTGNQQAAASDYKRAKQQRSRWLRDNLVDQNELQNFEERLFDEWLRRYNEMCEDIGDGIVVSNKIAGRELYRELQNYSQLRIRDRFQDPFMTRGSYQMLSNELRVGWHIDFNNLLSHLHDVEIEV